MTTQPDDFWDDPELAVVNDYVKFEAVGDTVALMFWPRNGRLSQAYLWQAPYDEALVEEALTRLDAVKTVTGRLGRGALPLLPTVEAYCHYCPFFLPGATDLEESCPGHVKA